MKKYILLIVPLILVLLSSCKVEFPDKLSDSEDISFCEQSEASSSNEINNSEDSSVHSTTTADSRNNHGASASAPSVTDDKNTKSNDSDTVSADTNQNTSGEKDKYNTDPIPNGKPKPVEPQDKSVNESKKHSATLSITCKTISSNMDKFSKDKLSVLPSDGIIYSERQVMFYEGESVFDVLVRETKKKRIHMEFENTPIYNSAYIEGIHNLYEFDCGDLSGWMYKVNGWFPNYGCSRYQLKAGDKIEWVYTCDLGRDVGCDWLDNTN